MKPTLKQYAYWNDDPNDPDASYWMMFDSLEDAVNEAGDGTWIYELNAKYLGRFKRKVSLIKQHERRKQMAKKSKKIGAKKRSTKKVKSVAQGSKRSARKTVSKK